MGEQGSQVISPSGQRDYETEYLWMVALRNPNDNVSTEKYTYPFCTLPENVSEVERAGVTNYLKIPTCVKLEPELTQ